MPEIQQPNIVGNFLQSYYGAQDRTRQQAADQMQTQRLQKQDMWAEEDRQHAQLAQKAQLVAQQAMAADDPVKWEAMRAANPGEQIPDFSQRQTVIARAMSIPEQIKQRQDERKMALDENIGAAQIGNYKANTAQSYAAADAARAQAEYTRSGKGSAGGKTLTSPMNKEFGALGDQFAQVKNLAASFNPNYASRGIFGFGADAMNAKDRTFGGSDAATWWQGYDRYKNVVRNDLFGASLTPGEKASFEAADITPGMDAKTIAANLAIQQRILDGSMTRRARSAAAQGFNIQAISELTGLGGMDGGTNSPPPPPPSPAAQGGPVQIKSAQDYAALPPGTTYISPDGHTRTKR